MNRAALFCATAVVCSALTSTAMAAGLFEPEPIGAETYAESFTVSVDLGGGAYLQGQLAVSNLGPGDGQGACRFLYVPGSGPGKEVSAAKKVDRDAWGYDTKSGPKFTVGPCTLSSVGKTVRLIAPLDEGRATVTMKAAARRIQPPNHEVKVGDAFYETEIIVPWAEVDVELVLGGKTTQRKGHGFLDHSRSTTLPGKLASRWVRFRILDPAQARLFLVRYPSDGGQPEAWAWSAGEAAPKSVGRVKVGQKPGGKTPVFRTLAMVNGQTWKMTSEALIQRYAPVEKHGMIGALVGSVVGNPITYTYVGKLDQAGQVLTGIMEVTLLQD